MREIIICLLAIVASVIALVRVAASVLNSPDPNEGMALPSAVAILFLAAAVILRTISNLYLENNRWKNRGQ